MLLECGVSVSRPFYYLPWQGGWVIDDRHPRCVGVGASIIHDRYPAAGVSVDNTQWINVLCWNTDTSAKKRERCFRHRLTCDFVAINRAAGILTLRSKLTCSLLHSRRFRWYSFGEINLPSSQPTLMLRVGARPKMKIVYSVKSQFLSLSCTTRVRIVFNFATFRK